MNVTNKLFSIKDFVSYSNTYIETGTCVGESLKRALYAGFKNAYTVELKKEFYEQSKKKFSGFPGATIKFFWGKSTALLPVMLSQTDGPCVIFLDAHPAGPTTAGHDELIAGDKSYSQHEIILKELQLILLHRQDHLIIIDDQRGPDTNNFEYLKLCIDLNHNYKFSFYDEQLEDGILYKHKIMVCNPSIL